MEVEAIVDAWVECQTGVIFVSGVITFLGSILIIVTRWIEIFTGWPTYTILEKLRDRFYGLVLVLWRKFKESEP